MARATQMRIEMFDKEKITNNLRRAGADILLIVIGVSIALAADSWLAERSEKIRTGQLLDALEAEWTAELVRIDEYNAEANLAKTAMIRIINASMGGPPSLTAAEAASLLEKAHRWHTFKPSDGALTTVLADGLQDIDDASLRLAVASWRTVLAKLVAEQAALRELGTMIGPRIETRIVQESGEASPSEPADYPYHGQGMETGKFVLHAIADDEWIAYWRHLVGVLERYQEDLDSVREELEMNLLLLRERTTN